MAKRLFQLLAFLFLIWMANCNNFSIPSKNREVSSVVGSVSQLPCPTASIDDVAMILWFKDSSGAPIYSYDARKENEPRHSTMKNDWGLRLYFRVWPNLRRLPALIIKDIQPNDGGVYRCRVDYRSAPTTNHVVRLKVIEPPIRLEIQDTSPSRPISDQQMVPTKQHSDITYLGPYQERQNVTIVCNAVGGNPMPEVKWYKNGIMIDSSYSSRNNTGTMFTTNELEIKNLGSDHSNDLYTCQASNNNESKAISHSVNLDVYLGVKEVDLDVPDEMTAGIEYKIECKATGAYPAVKMEIWKLQKRLEPKFQSRSDPDNVTSYSMTYKPEILDDELTISCKAENPWLNQKPIVARKILKIKYTPVAILRFGQNKTENFSEGESVLMECHVKANPPIYSITWFKGQQQLFSNESAGIRISGMTLVLTNLKPGYGGKYFCQAANAVGKEMSNPLKISLNLPPKCASSEAMIIPLAVGESHRLACYMLAWPPDLNFYWTLNRSNDIVPIVPVAVDNHTLGAIEDIPLEEFDEYIFPNLRTDGSGLLHQDEGSGNEINVENMATLQNDEGRLRIMGKSREPEKKPNNDVDGSGDDDGGGGSWKTNQNQNYLKGKGVKKSVKVEKSSSMSTTRTVHNVYKELKPVKESESGIVKESSTDGLIRSRRYKRHGRVNGFGSSIDDTGSLYGRWKAPQDSSDNIHHEAVLSYTIKSIDDYGEVACWARNSFGKQLLPCIFHIISKKEEDQDEQGDSKITRYSNGNLSGRALERQKDGEPDLRRESGILVPSKLPVTSGIILMVLLIFIASLGFSVVVLVMVAKRRRQLQRMIIVKKSSTRSSSNVGRKRRILCSNRFIGGGQVESSTEPIEKCTSTISSSTTTGFGSMSLSITTIEEEEPLTFPNIGKEPFHNKWRKSQGEEVPPCFTSRATFTVISNQNDFPPPPTSIISTGSTSHGYGSITEEDDDDIHREEEFELENS